MDEIDELIKEEWRELGFFYDTIKLEDKIVWTFYGSKRGLNKFAEELEKYISNPINVRISEHEHYGPYHYLKIMTWTEPIISGDYIAGTLQQLDLFRKLILDRLGSTEVGRSFEIDTEYSLKNTASVLFTIMQDDFDPVSMDGNYNKSDNNK